MKTCRDYWNIWKIICIPREQDCFKWKLVEIIGIYEKLFVFQGQNLTVFPFLYIHEIYSSFELLGYKQRRIGVNETFSENIGVNEKNETYAKACLYIVISIVNTAILLLTKSCSWLIEWVDWCQCWWLASL